MKQLFSSDSKKVIFFDMNQTLLNSEGAFQSAFIDIIDGFTGRSNSETKHFQAKTIWDRYEMEWKRKIGRISTGNTRPSKLGMQVSCLRKALRPYPFDQSDIVLKKMLHSIRKLQTQHVHAYPDVLEALTTLSRNYTLAIISNGKQMQQEMNLNTIGLASIIPPNHLITSEKAKIKKPKAAIFHYALQTMGIKANEAVMVGNSWQHDITGATRTSIDAIWLRRGLAKNRPPRKVNGVYVITIRSCKQLLRMFS